MTLRVFLATNNTKKLAELRRILAEQNLAVDVVTMADVQSYPEPAETEWTFSGNALIKARAGASHTGLVSLADDSGLCVDALGRMPGVRSSRWAGPGHDDVANLELVLRQIDDVEPERRGAQFRAVVALVSPDGREFLSEGVMAGHLTTAPRGDGGFGYDPIFEADEQPLVNGQRLRTNAELTADEKDTISHRGRAMRAIIPALVDVLGLAGDARPTQ